jgi:predicted glycosyl hydrolase (DUF1957 family)
VVKRPAQTGQTRRLRITDPSSAGRESLTCVSSDWQNGQRMAQLSNYATLYNAAVIAAKQTASMTINISD